jgi:hypothetical protein
MTISFRDFHPRDLVNFKPLDVYDEDAKGLTLMSYKSGAPVYTLIDETGVLGMVGADVMWEGVANIWTLLSDKILVRPMRFHRLCKHLMNIFFSEMRLVRAEAHVRVGHESGVRWIERLGFVREGVMRNYLGQGKHAYLYARCD